MKRILGEQFKPSDRIAAKREMVCITDLLTELRIDLDHGNYEAMQDRMKEIIRSIKQLKQMKQDNNHHKELTILSQQIEDKDRIEELYRHFKGHEAI